MAVTPPNYTQVPNEIFQLMSEMKDQELRVVLAVCRQTFGWQKSRDRISLTQIESITGLSRQGVINGIKKALERGVLARFQIGQTFEYEIHVSEPTSQLCGLALVNDVDQISQKLVNVVDTQKKDLKKEERNPSPRVYPVSDGPHTSVANASAFPEVWNGKMPKRAPKLSPANLTESDDLRVATYLKYLRDEITPTNADRIQQKVELEQAAVWEATCREWAEKEYNPTNFAGLFEKFVAKVKAQQLRGPGVASAMEDEMITPDGRRVRHVS